MNMLTSIPVDHVARLDDPAPEKRIAAWLACSFFGVFLGALALIPMDSAIVGNGAVTVSGNRQAVQHGAGGTVTSLSVREGQMVRKGDVLLTLSSTELTAQERSLTQETIALLAQRTRLIAERDGLADLSEPVEFAALPPSDRQLAHAALLSQKRIFSARRSSNAAQHGILSQRTRQSEEQAEGYRRQMAANREQRQLIGAELQGMRELSEKGFASINRIRALERSAAQLDGDYGALGAQVARIGEAKGEISLQSTGLERDVMKEVSQELRDTTLKIDEDQERLRALRTQLAQLQVRAPASGKVVNLKLFTVGGVVAPGEVILEIVPQNKAMIVTAHISPVDANEVVVGQAAQIRFPGTGDRNTPIINGKVIGVSADRLSDPRSGQSYFDLEVAIDSAASDPGQASPNIPRVVAGMPAEILVSRRKRTALQFIFEPLGQFFWLTGRER